MSTASARQALTEEQRHQIIAKLLAERRSQAANAASRQQQVELPPEERAARLQELMSRRAAAKQQQGPALPSQQVPVQHQQQQQPQAQHLPQQQQQQQVQQHHKHHHHQWHQTHREHQQRSAQHHRSHQQHQQLQRPPSSIASSCGRESLLSPGSTASLHGTTATAGTGSGDQNHHHHKQQQQQHGAKTTEQQLPRRPGMSAAVQLSAKPQPPPSQQQQQHQQVPTPRQQQQGRPAQQQGRPAQQQRSGAGSAAAAAAAAAIDRNVLSTVLDGPVDISALWASRASLTEQTSREEEEEEVEDDDSQGDECHSDSSVDSYHSSGSEEEVQEQFVLGSALTDGASSSDSEGSSAVLHSSSQAGGPYEYECSYEFASSNGTGSRALGSAELEGSQEWQLSGSLTFAPVQGSQPHPQQRLHQLRQLQQELLEKRQQQQQGRAASKTPSQQQQQQQALFHRPSPPAQPRSQQYNLQVGGYSGGGSPQPQHLPASYPHSRAQRLQQLAQPKALQRQKYDQMKAEAEQQALQQCSFTPKTGRGPQHRIAPPGSIGERLHKAAAEKRARLEQKAAELAHSDVEDCTFTPATNAAANARVLDSYEYVPLHKRLGQVMRSRSEKLAHIQQQVEAEVHSSATFAPRINPRSSMLADMRRSRSCSRAPCGGAGSGGGDNSLSPAGCRGSSPPAPGRQEQADASREGRDVSRGRSRERLEGGRRGRTWSEGALSRGRSQPRAEDSACTFAPSINARSEKMLQASGEIPLSFLQRQEYFDRLARERKQLLQLAVEDAHCSFVPATRSSSRSGRSDRGGSLDQESFLDRIERLAYTDKRRQDASRVAIADHVHNSECTFRPAINPRSARMVRATSLQELYENNRGRLRRDSVALACELQEQAECTFAPNLHKPGPCGVSPAEAKLSMSAEEVACVVDRLYRDPKSKEGRVGEAASYSQYQELKACTFKPEINREVPKTQGPVLVRGLGRFLELKDMARQQAEAKAAVEAKVFITDPKSPTAPFTTPQPFRLGPQYPSGYEARRRRAVVEAEAAVMSECTFQPRINTHHKSRQERVAELLAQQQ